MKIYDFDIKNKNYNDIEQNPFLGEIDSSPNLYEVFKLNGKWYTLGTVAANREYGAAHELKKFDLEETETNYENEITCPICGYVDRNSWEKDDREEEYQCGQCGAILDVERDVQITYSATVKELPTVLD